MLSSPALPPPPPQLQLSPAGCDCGVARTKPSLTVSLHPQHSQTVGRTQPSQGHTAGERDQHSHGHTGREEISHPTTLCWTPESREERRGCLSAETGGWSWQEVAGVGRGNVCLLQRGRGREERRYQTIYL